MCKGTDGVPGREGTPGHNGFPNLATEASCQFCAKWFPRSEIDEKFGLCVECCARFEEELLSAEGIDTSFDNRERWYCPRCGEECEGWCTECNIAAYAAPPTD